MCALRADLPADLSPTQPLAAPSCGHAMPNIQSQLVLPIRSAPLPKKSDQSLLQPSRNINGLQSRPFDGACSSVHDPNESSGKESDYEITLDLQGRKHLENHHGRNAFFILPGSHSAQYRFPMPGEASAHALRTALRNHLPSNLIADEYGVVKPLDDISNNHLPSLQAKLWRELPRDHNARISMTKVPLSSAVGLDMPLQTTHLESTIANVSNDEVRLAYEVMAVAELLTYKHIFILCENKTRRDCVSLTCHSRNDKRAPHIHTISLEPLLDWGTVGFAQDIIISRGKITVYRRNGEKLKEPLWAEATRKLAPENPVAYCVECLEHLINMRTRAWEILDQCDHTNGIGVQPIERPNQVHCPPKIHNVTTVHNGSRPQPGFARQATEIKRQLDNGSGQGSSVFPTYPQLDGPSPSPHQKENKFPSSNLSNNRYSSQAADLATAQGLPNMDNRYIDKPTSSTMPRLSLPSSDPATFSRTPSLTNTSTPSVATGIQPKQPSTTRTGTARGRPLRYRPIAPYPSPYPDLGISDKTEGLGEPKVSQTNTAFKASGQGTKREFHRMGDSNTAPYSSPYQNLGTSSETVDPRQPETDRTKVFTASEQGIKRVFGRVIDSNATPVTHSASGSIAKATEKKRSKQQHAMSVKSIISADEEPPTPQLSGIPRVLPEEKFNTAKKTTCKVALQDLSKAPNPDSITFYDPSKPKTQPIPKPKPKPKPKPATTKKKPSPPATITTTTTTTTTTTKPTSSTRTVKSPTKPPPSFPPLFAKPTSTKPSDIPSDYAPEAYNAHRAIAPKSTHKICTCHHPSDQPTTRIAQCANISCLTQWFHYACLDKSGKLKACHGTFTCQACLDAAAREEEEKRVWGDVSEEERGNGRLKRAFALPWSGKEIQDTFPGLGGMLGVKYPYGIGEERVVEGFVGGEEKTEKSASGYTAFAGRTTPQWMLDLWSGKKVPEHLKGKVEARWVEEEEFEGKDEDEEGYYEEYYEDEDEDMEAEQEEELVQGEGDEFPQDEDEDEPALKRARLD